MALIQSMSRLCYKDICINTAGCIFTLWTCICKETTLLNKYYFPLLQQVATGHRE